MKAVLFKNNKKENEKQPSKTGNVEVTQELKDLVNSTPIGEKIYLSAWDNRSDKGTEYISIAFNKPMEKKEYSGNPGQVNVPQDDLPF